MWSLFLSPLPLHQLPPSGRQSPTKTAVNGSPSKCPRFAKVRNWETGSVLHDTLHLKSAMVSKPGSATPLPSPGYRLPDHGDTSPAEMRTVAWEKHLPGGGLPWQRESWTSSASAGLDQTDTGIADGCRAGGQIPGAATQSVGRPNGASEVTSRQEVTSELCFLVDFFLGGGP